MYKTIVSILHIIGIIVLIGILFIEMTLYSPLPPEQGGMSYFERFSNIWYRSIPFYCLIFSIGSFIFWITKKKKS